MSMTKAEKARMEALERDLTHAVALRWSGFSMPAMIPPPEYNQPDTSGWTMISGLAIGGDPDRCIERGWSSSNIHGRGAARSDNPHMVASQRGVPLYATKRDALVAARLVAEREFAKRLAALDALIDAETRA